MAIDFSKTLTGDTVAMIFYAKRLLAGHETPFSKADFVDAIQTRADATLPADWSPQQRFSRAISGGDSVAAELYQAMKSAPGSEVRAAPIEKADDGPAHIGPAHAKMHSLAIDRQRERPISYPAAYSEVYTRPDNATLRAAVQREHLENAMEAIHGGVDHTMSIQEAQGMQPAKDFSATGTGDYSRAMARKSESAESELEKLARDYHAKHSEKSYEQCFSKILTAPENRALMKRSHDERIAKLGVRMAV
jgi:hypothetical protein